MRGRFYIVNSVDRPYEPLIAEKHEGRLYYINPELTDRYEHGFELDRATDLVDFGLEFEDQGDQYLVTKNTPSLAKYPDGSKREWQGSSYFTITKKGN